MSIKASNTLVRNNNFLNVLNCLTVGIKDLKKFKSSSSASILFCFTHYNNSFSKGVGDDWRLRFRDDSGSVLLFVRSRFEFPELVLGTEMLLFAFVDES